MCRPLLYCDEVHNVKPFELLFYVVCSSLASMGRQLSEHFNIDEFKGVEPDMALLFVLEWVRVKLKDSVVITDGPRTVEEQVAIYKDLSEKGKIATLENGKGTTPLIDYIPWSSRHLPSYESPFLRAVDFKVVKRRDDQGRVVEWYTGDEIFKKVLLPLQHERTDIPLGIGVGHYYCHVDVGREKPARWEYNY